VTLRRELGGTIGLHGISIFFLIVVPAALVTRLGRFRYLLHLHGVIVDTITMVSVVP
jgi:hypothetical protein